MTEDHARPPSGRWSDLGRLVPAVGQAWRRALGRRLSGEGLSDATALPVLVLYQRGDQPLRQGDLARVLGLEGSAVVRLLDTLEQRALLRRIEDPADRRVKHLELTDEGIALAQRAQRVARVLRESLLHDIPPEDVDTTYRVLRKIGVVLEDLRADPTAR